MDQIKNIVVIIALLVLAACSSNNPTETFTAEQGNRLTVKDAIVAIMLGAPKPKIGENQEDLKNTITTNLGAIIQKNDELIVARFITQGSQLESVFEYCDLEYHFSSSKFSRGPYVIGECSSIEVTGEKVN